MKHDLFARFGNIKAPKQIRTVVAVDRARALQKRAERELEELRRDEHLDGYEIRGYGGHKISDIK